MRLSPRSKFLLLMGVFAGPVVAAWLAYFGWRPAGHTNYGDLLEVAPLRQTVGTAVDGSTLRGALAELYLAGNPDRARRHQAPGRSDLHFAQDGRQMPASQVRVGRVDEKHAGDLLVEVVAHARGVGEQVAHLDAGVERGQPFAHEGQDRVAERQAPGGDEAADGERREELGYRGDAERGGRRVPAAVLPARPAAREPRRLDIPFYRRR